MLSGIETYLLTEGMVEKSEQFKEQGHQLHIASDVKEEDTEAAD